MSPWKIYPGNTIDSDGNAVTMSGAFTGAGPITFLDSVGGGSVTLTSTGNTYTGPTTINSGGTLMLSGSGTLATSSGLADNGVFDISGTNSGASIISLSGAGTVNLGAQNLTLTEGAGAFSGVISGSGGLVVGGGTVELSGANTYTGGTTITKGTLEVGDGVTDGAILGNVTDNGLLQFNRTDSIVFGGTISGAGGLTQFSTGTLTLTAVDTYPGRHYHRGGRHSGAGPAAQASPIPVASRPMALSTFPRPPAAASPLWRARARSIWARRL